MRKADGRMETARAGLARSLKECRVEGRMQVNVTVVVNIGCG